MNSNHEQWKEKEAARDDGGLVILKEGLPGGDTLFILTLPEGYCWLQHSTKRVSDFFPDAQACINNARKVLYAQ